MESISQAIQLGKELHDIEDPKIECTLELVRGRTLLRLGKVPDARSSMARVQELAGSADKKHEAMLLEMEGLVRLGENDGDGALRVFDQCVTLLQAQSVRSYELAESYLCRAEAHLAVEGFSQAYDDTTTALSLLDKAGEGLERGHVLRIKALAAYHMGRPKESRRLFIQSERELRRVGDLYELGRCLTDKAELAPRNEAESALADAAEAVNLFERVGVEPLAERARDIFAICHLRLQRAQHARSVLQQNSSKVIASSESMQAVLADCERAASRDVTVLITGETGVGKEVVARFVHDASARAQKNFVPVNCAAIPDSLFEREFFGHTKGAYTGADSDKPGLVEAADGGTLFLDEIGEMPLALQPKLLRLLQEGTYRRVGDVHEKKVSLRIVAATNRDLQDLVQEKTFREDLYYRLGWFRIAVPPLRERVDDMIDLTKMFLDRESLASGTIFWLQKETWTLFRRYSWPGNVRELEAAICSSIARADADGCIRVEHLPAEVREAMPRPHSSTLELQKHLDSQERELILRALRSADYQRARAARLLGIGRNTLYEKMKKFGIKPER